MVVDALNLQILFILFLPIPFNRKLVRVEGKMDSLKIHATGAKVHLLNKNLDMFKWLSKTPAINLYISLWQDLNGLYTVGQSLSNCNANRDIPVDFQH